MTRHVLLPAVMPLAVVALYFTPVDQIGCKNRGLLAITIVLVSALAALGMALAGARARRPNPERHWWWFASVLLLAMPALLVLGPLR